MARPIPRNEYVGNQLFQWRYYAPFLIACMVLPACAGKRIDVAQLANADTIVVRDDHGRDLKEIRDPFQIQRAVEFIDRYSNGWKERWQGPVMPRIGFYFYRSDCPIGWFGFGNDDYLASWFRARKVPRAARDELLDALGVKLPPNVPP